jgi:hypothetical protein
VTDDFEDAATVARSCQIKRPIDCGIARHGSHLTQGGVQAKRSVEQADRAILPQFYRLGARVQAHCSRQAGATCRCRRHTPMMCRAVACHDGVSHNRLTHKQAAP